MRWLCLVALLLPVDLKAGGGPENVLVVVNIESPDSMEIADHYMRRRAIPAHHIVALSLDKGDREVCTLETYRSRIELPVAEWLEAHPAAPITHIVLTRDVPAMVKDVPVFRKVHKSNEKFRSTTHLLSVLHCAESRLKPLGYNNPLLTAVESLDRKSPPKIGGDAVPVYAGALLNAFTVDDVKAMIDRAVDSETSVAKGRIYLGRSKKKDPRGCYNADFPRLADWLGKRKKTVEIVDHPGDKEKKLLTGKQDVLFYMFGQSHWDKTFPATNTYVPGCVVDNLTSFALNPWSFRNPKKGQTTMCHFLAAGATAVHGCVSEPYTAAFSPRHRHMELFFSGYSLGESYLMAHPLMPWMNLVVGDPLLQPHVPRPEVTLVAPAKNDEQKWIVKGSADERTGSLRLYRNGVELHRVEGRELEFELPDWDSRTDDIALVAVGASPARVQGRAVTEGLAPMKSFEHSAQIKRDRVKVRFKAKGGTPVFVLVAPGHEEHGKVQRRSSISLKDPDRLASALLVLKNAPVGSPRLYRLIPPEAPPEER